MRLLPYNIVTNMRVLSKTYDYCDYYEHVYLCKKSNHCVEGLKDDARTLSHNHEFELKPMGSIQQS